MVRRYTLFESAGGLLGSLFYAVDTKKKKGILEKWLIMQMWNCLFLWHRISLDVISVGYLEKPILFELIVT